MCVCVCLAMGDSVCATVLANPGQRHRAQTRLHVEKCAVAIRFRANKTFTYVSGLSAGGFINPGVTPGFCAHRTLSGAHDTPRVMGRLPVSQQHLTCAPALLLAWPWPKYSLRQSPAAYPCD